MRLASCWVFALALAACGEVVDPAVDAPPPGPPSLTAVEPPRAPVAAMLTLTGTAFGSEQGGSTVTVGGEPATVQSWSDTSVVVAVPDVLPGNAPVTVTTQGGTSGPEPMRVILPPRAYVEVNLARTDGFNAITVMSFDQATGALAEVGVVSTGLTPRAFGGCATNLLVHEATRRVFVNGTGGVAVFSIDPATGMLSHVPGSPFSSGGTVGAGIGVDGAGNRLFQVGSSSVFVFDIGPTGALTAVVGSPFAAVPTPDVLVASRDGTFLYVNTESRAFHAFSVTANGSLTPLPGSPYATGGTNISFSITRRPTTDQLFFTLDQLLQVWQPAPGTGIPTAVAGSPFAIGTVTNTAHHVAFTPDGNRAYIGTHTGSQLIGVNVTASGATSVMTGSPWTFTPEIAGFGCMAVARDSNHLVVANPGRKQVSVLGLATDGTPSHVTGSPFSYTTQDDSSGLAITF